jgi:hypothetical protein
MSPDLPHRDATDRERFARDERGAILVLWALFLAVAFGFLALAFDLGRIATTQTQLQSFADQVALAAAGELDGRPDAMTRARAAANGLIAGQQTFGLGTQALGGSDDYRLTFLTTLPADDGADDPGAILLDDTEGARARYVRVDVEQRTVVTPFAHVNAVLTGNSQISANVGASATAGFTAFACDITPLFFCVPSDWNAKANVGQQIMLRTGGGNLKKNTQDEVEEDLNAKWGPGNFGFLNPASLPIDPEGPCKGLATNSAQLYRCLVGAERAITTCVRMDEPLRTRTGQIQGLAGAFNTRFDIFEGPMKNLTGNDDYRPAPNVVQGTVPKGKGQKCRGNNVDPSSAIALPRDSCIDSDSCRFGGRDWDRDLYLSTNHGNTNLSVADLNGDGRISRYEVYRAEIQAAGLNGNILPDLGATPYESGRPMCHDSRSEDPDRRVMVAAAVDCTATPPQGQSTVFAVEYVKVFLTEPVGSTGSDFDIMVEVVDTAGGAGSGGLNGVYQDFVQLYR